LSDKKGYHGSLPVPSVTPTRVACNIAAFRHWRFGAKVALQARAVAQTGKFGK
jgi:hypothetical protein